MQKITISYDEYDDLCEIAQKIVCKLSRLPTTEEIDMMTSCHIGHFLLLLTWLVENENGIPDTQENKQLREYVNDKIEDAMCNYMFFTKQTEKLTDGCVYLDINEYTQIYNIIKKIEFIHTEEIPASKEIQEFFLPSIKFSFGFLLFFLYKGKTVKSSTRYVFLKQFMGDHYELLQNRKLVNMTLPEYDNLCASMSNCLIKRENWWPSVEEIEDIIIPNLRLCYEFILWIIYTGPAPETAEEKEVVKILRSLIRNNTNITEEVNVPWL